MSDRPTRVDKTDARAGRSGVGVRYVLIGGLILVVLALGAAFVFVR